MGFFSFKTNDTKKSIANVHNHKMPTFKVLMLDDKGNKWSESKYNGYGEFGGKDIFVLIAEMNGHSDMAFEKLRDKGIEIYYSAGKFKMPMLLENDGDWKKDKLERCEFQGYFY
jgi:hypothetical protein